MTREELRAKHEQLFKFDSGSGPGQVEDSSVIVELLDENGKLRSQLAEALKCPQESWECAKEIRTLTKEREALRTWNQQLIASEALARTHLALAQGALKVFSNRRKLAYALREESPHLYAFVEATGCVMDPYLARLDAKEKE
jgi:hypothetical protein